VRPIRPYRDDAFVFLGPQAGPAENVLISRLAQAFTEVPTVKRAYLARVASSAQAEPRVMLCIVPDGGPSKSVLADVARTFARLFNTETFLDIMFLEEERVESDLRRVCSPFYDRTA